MSHHDVGISTNKKYRPLFILRLLYWIASLFSVAFAIWLLIVFDWLFLGRPILIIVLGIYALLALYGLFRSLQIRLEVSDKGIFYDSGSYIISTPWNNVERIGKRVPNISINIPVEGLVLRTPSANKRHPIASVFWSSAMGYYDVDYSCSIPLQGLWSWNWRKSELAEDLKRHLPHLF